MATCELLGDTFDFLVQAGLAVSAVATLWYKRHTERPRRPLLIWSFDASKQAYAGVLQHVVNLFFGVALARTGAGGAAGASECAWYLVSFAISTLLGIFWLFLAMRLWALLVDRLGVELLRSGEYGHPPSWRPWLAQLLVWGLVASGEKVLTVYLVILPWHTTLGSFAAGFERPLLPYPNLELLLIALVDHCGTHVGQGGQRSEEALVRR